MADQIVQRIQKEKEEASKADAAIHGFYLSNTLKEDFRSLCVREGVSMSSVVDLLIRDYVSNSTSTTNGNQNGK